MGEVYRARDAKLNRDVAIKMLLPAVANDPDRLARFSREAQLLASLNHPNIAHVHGLEEAGGGVPALVMELVEGPTLADRLARGAMSIVDALPIAKQIAEALEAAHERGIIHRDLKPANIKVRDDGAVKVLDFGLAKAMDPPDPMSPGVSASPTITSPALMTGAGVILGTAAYMSPEQAKGQTVDKRTDIWAFGVVLYEMLAGRRPFKGDDVSEMVASVLKDKPDFSALPRGVPSALRKLLERCLERDVKNRLRDIGDARIVLQDCLANPSQETAATTPTSSSRSRMLLPWVAVAVVAIAGGIGWWKATRPIERQPVRLDAEISTTLTMPRGPVAMSPDGSRIVVRLTGPDGAAGLYVRALATSTLTKLPGTEQGGTPFFSPDSQWIGFAADNHIKKISVTGGGILTVCDARSLRGASWGDDDQIVFSRSQSLFRVSAAGGDPVQIIDAGVTALWPQVLPGSQAVLFTHVAGQSTNYDEGTIEAVSIKDRHVTTVVRGGYSAKYVATPNGGRLIYMNGGRLLAVPFDPVALKTTGTPVPVVDGVYAGLSDGAVFAASSAGTVVFEAGKGTLGTRTIVWLDHSGGEEPLHRTLGTYYSPRLSPDGRRLAMSLDRGVTADIWVKDLERDTMSRVTGLDGVSEYPVWTPDGTSIMFHLTSPTAAGLYSVRNDGAGEPIRLADDTLGARPYSVSADGKHLAMIVRGTGGAGDVAVAALGGDAAHPTLGTPEPFTKTPSNEGFPSFSPDGRWLAYASNESGVTEVYVRPYPGPGGRTQISNGGGTTPIWSRAGSELLYVGAGGRAMSAAYSAKGDTFTAAKPSVWSERLVHTFASVYGWDLAPDGKRIAAIRLDPDDQKPVTHLTFLLNYFDVLQPLDRRPAQ